MMVLGEQRIVMRGRMAKPSAGPGNAFCEAMGSLGPARLYSMRQYEDGWGLLFEAGNQWYTLEKLAGHRYACNTVARNEKSCSFP
ncbi:hypothetical protein [Lihuaxuella thermophila]|uniref:hypothetical protein n=1 Tax=Lihuaxuella thermophila TaxID=1173111 RepID=UPI000B7E54B3|nr:hypothetical protein [Lihuaxuella thermophila]